MSDRDSEDPRHNPDEASRLLREMFREGGRPLTADETIEFIARPIFIPCGHLPIAWSGKGRKPTKTRYEYSAGLRRGLYHNLVRLPANRRKAAATRLKQGDQSRLKVFPLVLQALNSGTPRRKLRAEVTRLALAGGVRGIPADWQLDKLIAEVLKAKRLLIDAGFLKVDTTT